MPEPAADTRPPVVLIVDDQEWSSRSLESVLAPNGYAVMRVYSARTGLERARTLPPDLIFINTNLPNGDGVGLCRALREDPQFSASMPILITGSERPTREQRLEALRAGAWDFVSYPIDAQELLLRLEAYMKARFETSRVWQQSLIDQPTGLYNLRGLERRAQELRSQAHREQQPLACVVLAQSWESETEGTSFLTEEQVIAAAAARLGKALKQIGRTSDAIGRLGQIEFAILAPSTDGEGAVKLAERLAGALRSLDHETDERADRAPIQLRAGYDAVDNVREAPLEAKDLLLHATIALRTARSQGNGDWIHAFDPPKTTRS